MDAFDLIVSSASLGIISYKTARWFNNKYGPEVRLETPGEYRSRLNREMHDYESDLNRRVQGRR